MLQKSILLLLFSFLFTPFCSFNQIVSGTWKGVFYPQKSDPAKGIVISFFWNSTDKVITTRSETITGKNVSFKKANISISNDNKLTLQETLVISKSKENKNMWCKNTYILQYDTLDGFLKGTFTSSDCANQNGEILLFRTDEDWNGEINIIGSKIWVDDFISNYRKGNSSPDKLQIDRENFKFEPIYFDFDKDVLKPEYKQYLEKMAKMVEGHSDIRIKITGHTDSDGSEQYNDGLSKRRATAIETFFKSIGIPTNRLEFDFKGERIPIATNKTSEGRQLNRRVDFAFIYE